MIFSRRRVLSFVACLLPGLLVGCGGADNPESSHSGPRRIIILTNGDSPFWDACRVGLQDADKQLKLAEAGLQAVFEPNDGTTQGQLNKLRQYGSQSDIAAIGISVLDANNAAIADEMRKLRKRGIHIITIDSDLDSKHHDARQAFVGTDNVAAGRELGICARNLLPDGGEYVTFVGRTGAQNALERIGGFAEGAGKAFKSVDSMADDTDRTRARDNVRNALRNHPELQILVGIWSYNAPAIVDVVKETNRRDKLTILVFDAEPLTVEQMGDGMVDAMLVQNPYQMGFQGVRLMKALVEDDQAVVQELYPNFGKPQGDIYDTGLKVVVPNDKSPLKADMFGKKTEFLTLSAFREWLEKYKLQGS